MPERTFREVRRRSGVIGVLPTVDSWVRLVTCYLVEYSEDWGIDRSYFKKEKNEEAMERNQDFLMVQAANWRGIMMARKLRTTIDMASKNGVITNPINDLALTRILIK